MSISIFRSPRGWTAGSTAVEIDFPSLFFQIPMCHPVNELPGAKSRQAGCVARCEKKTILPEILGQCTREASLAFLTLLGDDESIQLLALR